MGHLLYVYCADANQVSVLDTKTNTVKATISLGKDEPGGLA